MLVLACIEPVFGQLVLAREQLKILRSRHRGPESRPAQIEQLQRNVGCAMSSAVLTI
jgi:hypothetical protein